MAGLPTLSKLDPTLDWNKAWVAKMNSLVDCLRKSIGLIIRAYTYMQRVLNDDHKKKIEGHE